MESEINTLLREYQDALEAQVKEVAAQRVKQTKAGALRMRKRSLELATAGKELRKVSIAVIG